MTRADFFRQSPTIRCATGTRKRKRRSPAEGQRQDNRTQPSQGPPWQKACSTKTTTRKKQVPVPVRAQLWEVPPCATARELGSSEGIHDMCRVVDSCTRMFSQRAAAGPNIYIYIYQHPPTGC